MQLSSPKPHAGKYLRYQLNGLYNNDNCPPAGGKGSTSRQLIVSRQKPGEPVCARPDHRFTTGGAPTSPPESPGTKYTQSAGRDSRVRDPYRIRCALRNTNRVRYPQRRGHMKRVNVKLLLPFETTPGEARRGSPSACTIGKSAAER